MKAFADIIDAAAEVAGNAARWLLLAIAGLELVVFFSRAVFGLSWPSLGETGLILNAVVVLFGGGKLLWTQAPLIAIPAPLQGAARFIQLGAGALAILLG